MGVFLRRSIAVLACVLLLLPSESFAQKGGGGRSYSGGSSSSGGTKSYSGGSSSSGGTKSYSGGSSSGTSKPKSPAGSSGSSGGRSYSGGSSGSSGGGGIFGGSSGLSSGSSGGRSYSGGGNSGGGNSKPAAPPPPKFDSLGAKEQLKVESRQSYQASSAPKGSYTTPGGKTYDMGNRSSDVTRLRSTVTQEKWVNRETRMQSVYVNYWNAPQPSIVYNDHFNTFFWLWLLDRSAEERRMWAYHHYNELDSRRLAELRLKDAEFDARLRALEQQKLARNTGYTPPGTEEDLMYTNGYVDAAFNPEARASSGGGHSGGGDMSWIGGCCFWVFFIVVAGFLVWAVVYIVFIRRT